MGIGFVGRLWGIQELGTIIYEEIREASRPAYLVMLVTTAITATSGDATAAVIAAVATTYLLHPCAHHIKLINQEV